MKVLAGTVSCEVLSTLRVRSKICLSGLATYTETYPTIFNYFRTFVTDQSITKGTT